jgi:hypothetical protein
MVNRPTKPQLAENYAPQAHTVSNHGLSEFDGNRISGLAGIYPVQNVGEGSGLDPDSTPPLTQSNQTKLL